MKRTTVMTMLIAMGLLVRTIAPAQTLHDHLQCFKIKDSLKNAVYTAELSPSNPYFPGIEPGCKIRVPAVQLCVDVAKSDVTPVPPGSAPGLPGQTYLCYLAKCNKFATTFETTDQFGVHQVAVKSTRLLCAPVSGSCTDEIQDGNETGTDCGGSCSTHCANGIGCVANGDCQSGFCNAGTCSPASTPSCSDGIQNGNETATDCGGSCPKCPNAAGCAVDSDCQSGICDGTCKPAAPPPSCTDGIKNGGETDKDCGGSCTSFLKCADGLGCVVNGDCQSGLCNANVCIPATAPTPNCFDGLQNGDETGKDCGGSCLLKCVDGLGCVVNSDCQSGICSGNVCLPNSAPPPPPPPSSCFDGIQDGDETGKDCGGSCTAFLQCGDGQGCVVNSDCQSGICGGNVCLPNSAPPPPSSCFDGIQDGDETGKDCGGSCTAFLQCGDGQGCVVNTDCQSGICGGNTCLPNAAPPPPPAPAPAP